MKEHLITSSTSSSSSANAATGIACGIDRLKKDGFPAGAAWR
jgi:hypothetical protein